MPDAQPSQLLPKHCPKCNYSHVGLNAARCPECGWIREPLKPKPQTLRRVLWLGGSLTISLTIVVFMMAFAPTSKFGSPIGSLATACRLTAIPTLAIGMWMGSTQHGKSIIARIGSAAVAVIAATLLLLVIEVCYIIAALI